MSGGAHPTAEDQNQVVMLAVSSLLPGDSPRLGGENGEYVALLAESAAETLPPIVVQRATMRVIDGRHRVRAATLRGQDAIAARFYDGGDEDAFVLAVRANVTHGLPLSLAERTAAAARIMRSHPHRSDRTIAAATGLAGTTVGTIRRCSTAAIPRSNTRVGRDGRVRPVNSAAGRRLATELLSRHPDASLREIARAAGIAPATVLDVRDRVRAGTDPVPPRQRRAERPDPSVDPAALLQQLRKDPSLRFTESGRTLLRCLDSDITGATGWAAVADTVPTHCAGLVAELAREKAQQWNAFATQIDRRRNVHPTPA